MPPQNFAALINVFLRIISLLLPLVMSLAFLSFIWGLAKFIMNADDTKAQEAGKNLMKWGLVALFVMTSVFGILRYAYSDVGFSGSFGIPLLPTNK